MLRRLVDACNSARRAKKAEEEETPDWERTVSLSSRASLLSLVKSGRESATDRRESELLRYSCTPLWGMA